MESLKLCLLAASLSGTETLATQPASHLFTLLHNPGTKTKTRRNRPACTPSSRNRGRRRHNGRPKQALNKI
ncbi:MAG: hypothetical protein ACP5JW_03715 [Candidatus Bathyarchaeia archaeon]